MDRLLELVVMGLLAATLFHAVRLERALGVLKQDRALLETLVAGFNASTQEAEQSVARLRAAADGAGGELARQMERARALQDDLRFLMQRGDAAADRLERAVRQQTVPAPPLAPVPRLPSQAERDLMRALRRARGTEPADARAVRAAAAAGDNPGHGAAAGGEVRLAGAGGRA